MNIIFVAPVAEEVGDDYPRLESLDWLLDEAGWVEVLVAHTALALFFVSPVTKCAKFLINVFRDQEIDIGWAPTVIDKL